MRQWIGYAAAFALAGCGGGGDGNQSGDGNQASTAKAGGGASANVTMQPGQWEMTVTVTRMNVPGMPAGMTPPMPPPQTSRTCITPEEAQQASSSFLNETTGAGEGCTSQNSSMSGGRIQANVQCNRPEGQVRMTMNGQYSATTLDMTQQVQTNQGGRNVEMEARIAGRRTGECPAGGEGAS
jgi:hypothetical protein